MSSFSANLDLIFRALGDPTRRALVNSLRDDVRSISQLADTLGVTLTAVSQHLQILQEAGLVSSEKVGRVRSCKLNPAGLASAEQWLQEVRSTWEKRLDALGALLAES